MFRLESNRLKREFKIADGKLYASQIVNKYSGMSFVPDGNGSEFVVHFATNRTCLFIRAPMQPITFNWMNNAYLNIWRSSCKSGVNPCKMVFNIFIFTVPS